MTKNSRTFEVKRHLEFRKMGDIKTKKLEKYAPYLAGLLDGEGSFVLRETGKKYLNFSPQIEIQMNHEQTINFVADVFNVKPASPHRKKGKRVFTHRVLVTTQKEIRQICNALIPYSKTKQKQMRFILRCLALKSELKKTKRNSSQYRQILLNMIDVYIEVKKLNERDSGKPVDYKVMKQALLEKVPAA